MSFVNEEESVEQQIRWQREERERYHEIRHEVHLRLEEFLRAIQLPVDVSLLRQALDEHDADEPIFYHRFGNLKGQDYSSGRFEDEKSRLWTFLETDTDIVEVRRTLRISSIELIHGGYKFEPEIMTCTQGLLVSPGQTICAKYRMKDGKSGFFFPEQGLRDGQYVFQFDHTFHLGFARLPDRDYLPEQIGLSISGY